MAEREVKLMERLKLNQRRKQKHAELPEFYGWLKRKMGTNKKNPQNI